MGLLIRDKSGASRIIVIAAIVIAVAVVLVGVVVLVALPSNNQGVVAPGAPSALRCSMTGGVVHLTWNASTNVGSGITGYRVYRSSTSESYGAPLANLTSRFYNDSIGGTAAHYYYVAKAYNSAGDSPGSNEVEVVGQETPTMALMFQKISPGTYKFIVLSISRNDVSTSDSPVSVSPQAGVTVGAWVTVGSDIAAGDYFQVSGMALATQYTVNVTFEPTGGVSAQAILTPS